MLSIVMIRDTYVYLVEYKEYDAVRSNVYYDDDDDYDDWEQELWRFPLEWIFDISLAHCFSLCFHVYATDQDEFVSHRVWQQQQKEKKVQTTYK